jgi:hypothetical protein
MTAEKRRFGMHQNLLYDVILRQAGTLQKAILEGVMNAIDAGATRCDVAIDGYHFSVCDDGHGFQSRREIEDFFETFGSPHEEGDATYGRFRMGRGQMMAFGKNTWRSRTFEMKVDIKHDGLDYDLYEHQDDFSGTRIDVDLYDPILPSDLERIKSELRNFVAWAQIPVFLNDEQINKTPAEVKWDFEDEYAYYSLSSERKQLLVYNLGVLVNSFWSGRFGIGGTIVSKQQLEVNFARNDVQSTCPVFKSINAQIKKKVNKGVAKKTKLTDAERDIMVRDFLAGDMDAPTAVKLRAITDVTGRSWPIEKLLQLPHKFSSRILLAERGDQMIETAQRRGVAFSIDKTTLERFGSPDCETFLKRIKASAGVILRSNPNPKDYSAHHRLTQLAGDALDRIDVVERDELREFVSPEHIPLLESELTLDMKLLRSSIERGYQQMIRQLNLARYEDRRFSSRQILLGKSDTALAWTDGTRNIWIDVKHAKLLRRGMVGAYQIATTLLHEQIHEGPDTGTHQHDMEFYSSFHDMMGVSTDPVGAAADRMVTVFINKLQSSKKKVSKTLLARDDTDLQIEALRKEIDDIPTS